jgi:hypothetical protein
MSIPSLYVNFTILLPGACGDGQEYVAAVFFFTKASRSERLKGT